MTTPIKPLADRSLAFAIFGALAVLGAGLVMFSVGDFARARASVSWPRAEAVVLASAPHHKALRYVYSVEGRKYEGRRARFLTASLDQAKSSSLKPGDLVMVAIDPRDPSVSVAYPGGSGALFALLAAIGGVLSFVGGGGLIRATTASSVEETHTNDPISDSDDVPGPAF